MKLIQHCHDALPKHVSGAVLGIDMDGHLQATNCFPYLQSDEEAQLGWDYQLEMLKAARSVRAMCTALLVGCPEGKLRG